MRETRLLRWKDRLLLAATIIAVYFVIGLLAQAFQGNLKAVRHLKIPTVFLVGYLWAMRGYWLTWKDMLIVALLSMVPVNILILPTLMGMVRDASPLVLAGLLLLGVLMESLMVMGGLWVGRIVAVLSGKLQKPGTGGE